MHMHRRWFACAMLVLLIAPLSVRAELGPSPLLELRAAAEAHADVDPDAVAVPRRDSLPVALPHEVTASVKADTLTVRAEAKAAGVSGRVDLKEAIRGAVHAEIAREVTDRPQVGSALGAGKGTPKPNETGESGRSEVGLSRAAAMQSQQARQNQAVSQANKAARGQSEKLMGPTIIPPGKTKALP